MNKFKLAGCFILALAISFAIVTPSVAYAQQDTPGIRVSGAASVTAEPDFATVVLGVETTSDNPQSAITENNAIVNDVFAALVATGISTDDIVTAHFSLSQTMDFSMGWRGEPTGYSVFNSVTVTIHDLDAIGAVLGAGIEAGANISGGIIFGVLDPSPLYYEALQLAVQDARNKADAIAAAMGLTITGITSVTEASTWNAPVFRGAAAPQALSASMEMDMMMVGGNFVPIQTGQITITARIEVIYSVN